MAEPVSLLRRLWSLSRLRRLLFLALDHGAIGYARFCFYAPALSLTVPSLPGISAL